MSVAQKLPEISPLFMQDCPLCSQSNRMVIKGVRHREEKREIYPDIGYSFCNCKNIFYTDFNNVIDDNDENFSNSKNHIEELKKIFDSIKLGYRMVIRLPDPFFCDWGRDPHEFLYWNPRQHHIIWDMEQLCEEARKIGFVIEKAEREFSLDAKNTQVFRIKLMKPVDKNDPLYLQLFTRETKLRAATQAAKDHFGNMSVFMAEVGVLRGDYSALMMQEYPFIEKIHLVDMWNKVWDIPDQEEHEDNYKYVQERFHYNKKVNIIVGDSVESASKFKDGQLDYVYIDANHLYEPVKADILAWLPKVRTGGIIGGHDYDYAIRPSVKEAVHEIFGDKVQHGENQNSLHDWWVIL